MKKRETIGKTRNLLNEVTRKGVSIKTGGVIMKSRGVFSKPGKKGKQAGNFGKSGITKTVSVKVNSAS